MKAWIVNYRMGRHTQNPRQMIVKVEGVEDREAAAKLKGKQVIWTSPAGKEMEGEVKGPHGNKGAVRAKFKKGLPGQSVGTQAEVK